ATEAEATENQDGHTLEPHSSLGSRTTDPRRTVEREGPKRRPRFSDRPSARALSRREVCGQFHGAPLDEDFAARSGFSQGDRDLLRGAADVLQIEGNGGKVLGGIVIRSR